MAVKYVKDFAFDSGFGFSGSSGKTPVRAYMRGGAVKSNPTKAPSIAPAMVEKRSQGLGGLTPETKKLAAYNKPHVAGKKGAKVPQYAKGGAVKKTHAKKEMPSFLKAKMMKKANGGPVAEITAGDGMSPLQMMQQEDPPLKPLPPDDPRLLPSLPPLKPLDDGELEYDTRGNGKNDRVDYDPGNRKRDFLRQLLERDTERMRGDAAQQMRDLDRINRTGPGADFNLDSHHRLNPNSSPPTMPPVGALTPVPEEPFGRRLSGPPPPPGMKVNPNYGKPGQDYYVFIDDAARQEAMPQRPEGYDLEAGMRAGLSNPTRPMLPAPIEPGAGGSGVRSGTGSLRDLGVGLGRLPSPLAAAGREAAKMGRREMRADRNEMARDIMDRYIAGPRRAMPAAGRRGVPVAPRKPMIDRSMLQPYMPSIPATTPEESDAYFKSIGRTPSPEARFAKGGKVSKGEAKVGKVMGEFKRGELHSGSKKGPVVKNPKQAVAIALSEARAAGAKMPKRKAMGGKACG